MFRAKPGRNRLFLKTGAFFRHLFSMEKKAFPEFRFDLSFSSGLQSEKHKMCFAEFAVGKSLEEIGLDAKTPDEAAVIGKINALMLKRAELSMATVLSSKHHGKLLAGMRKIDSRVNRLLLAAKGEGAAKSFPSRCLGTAGCQEARPKGAHAFE